VRILQRENKTLQTVIRLVMIFSWFPLHQS
jgi:hypothetical protein